MTDQRKTPPAPSLESAASWLEELPVAAFVMDGSGKPLYSNRAARELLGRGIVETGPENLAQVYRAYIAGTDREYPAERMPIVRALSGEESIVEDIEIRHPDKTIALEVRGAPIRDPEGTIRFAVAAFTDITDRRKVEEALRESEAQLQAVFAASPDIITMIAPDGTLGTSSPAYRDILGYEPEEYEQRDRMQLIHPEDRERVDETLRSLVGGRRTAIVRCRIRHKDGHWVALEVHTRAITDDHGQPGGFASVSRDVSDQVVLEEALRSAKEDAERANHAKSEFLSRMSHELRTPLNAILGFAQLLDMEDLDADQRDSTKQIIKGGRRLLELINEVLDISRIESGRLRLSLEPVHLGDVISESIDLIRPLAEERGIRVRSELPRPLTEQHVWADRQRLGQVLLNLLSNAIKYNIDQGSVTVTCTGDADKGIRVTVADTGPGVPDAKVPLLFEPFERLGVEEGSVEGTGLGLALSKGLTEAMGGRMAFDPVRGQGTTFWVEFQAADPPATGGEEPAEGEIEPKVQAGHKVVLYIEDNLSNLKLVERLLARRSDVELISAMTGGLGIELARQHVPDLILLDLHLPDLGGDEVLRRLRRDPRTAAVPVVMLSADALPGEIKRLLAAGADDYLTKPFDISGFMRVLDRFETGRS